MFPSSLASAGKTYCSPDQESPNPIKPTRSSFISKSDDINVKFIKRESHCAGSKSMYKDKSKVTTIVTTNGTENCQRGFRNGTSDLTIRCHRLPERWPNTQHNTGKYVLITRDQEQRGVLRIICSRMIFIYLRGLEPE